MHCLGLPNHEVMTLREICHTLADTEAMIAGQLQMMLLSTPETTVRYNQILKTLLCIRDHHLADKGLYKPPEALG